MQEETNMMQNEDKMTAGDAPHGDGTVSDEDVNKISEHGGSPPAGGQDHSTENYGESMPDKGGAPDGDEAGSDIADINE